MNSIILDTNVFLLFIMGLLNPEKISSHKRTSIFTVNHFTYLEAVIRNYKNILICPNIITEIDNLLQNSFTGDDKFRYLIITKEIFTKSIEKYYESKIVITDWEYERLGITDAVILRMAKEADLLVSGDSTLCDYAKSLGITILDFKKYVNDTLFK
ncbi:MAG: hypothetical protein A2Y62_04520 [Candidatus Fischerbacteria bacterium RBG_13_37_8]|uniref:PIN domain-containing protein n=1 Tax=Candidatus Fischerbacteria bacterium RBG_13_37_8 TaxID=1817863 RepID=A0A1F5V7N2_9BACT|nr:MAG: hypothetical protein A2Y62_04520 [Candidatus Fischerbacteria bacterium RBG_13_37_8]